MTAAERQLQRLTTELSQTFGKLTRFKNEVVEILGSLDAPAADQILIAERVLAERPRGVAGYAYECVRKDRREGQVAPGEVD